MIIFKIYKGLSFFCREKNQIEVYICLELVEFVEYNSIVEYHSNWSHSVKSSEKLFKDGLSIFVKKVLF